MPLRNRCRPRLRGSFYFRAQKVGWSRDLRLRITLLAMYRHVRHVARVRWLFNWTISAASRPAKVLGIRLYMILLLLVPCRKTCRRKFCYVYLLSAMGVSASPLFVSRSAGQSFYTVIMSILNTIYASPPLQLFFINKLFAFQAGTLSKLSSPFRQVRFLFFMN